VEVLVTVVGGLVIAFVASAVAKWRAEFSKEHCVHGAEERLTGFCGRCFSSQGEHFRFCYPKENPSQSNSRSLVW
jgi:hypothetical protein